MRLVGRLSRVFSVRTKKRLQITDSVVTGDILMQEKNALLQGSNERSVLENALLTATTSERYSAESPKSTTVRTITRRGVVWLGQTCNLHCQFCYFIDKIHSKDHPEHAFMSPGKAKKIFDALVGVYGNNAIDIQGGEPTIYKNIHELISYCREIGLIPTLITNAIALDKKDACLRLKEAGVRDLLISVHGLADVYDTLVGLPGAHVRQMRALRNLQETGIPFRFNCVLSKPVLPQLDLLAELAVKTGAKVVNFISFNPFEDQSRKGRRNTENVPRYTEVREKLTKALDILDDAGVEANVRYFPLCMLNERHRKSGYNFQQLPYDHHEWDYASWAWTGLQPQRMKKGELSTPISASDSRLMYYFKKPLKYAATFDSLRPLLYKAHNILAGMTAGRRSKEEIYRSLARIHAEIHCKYEYGKACGVCTARDICDGFHGDYAHIFGTDEAEAVETNSKISDPLYYIRHQIKLVEKEDEDWALPA